MKLCFLGGTNSIHLKRWISYFAKGNHDIYWISLEPINKKDVIHFKSLKLYEIKRVRLRMFSPINFILNVIWIRFLLKKIKPDILHAHYSGVVGAIGALSNFHPFILTPWGHDIFMLPKSKIFGPIVKYALAKADLITCDGENTREAIIELGINKDKIKMICFGVDIKKFKPESNRVDLKRKLYNSDAKIIISLRNLRPIYDIESLIKSIPLILKKIPNVKFILAGDGELKKKLINLAKALNVYDATIFVGSIPNNELPQYLNAADIYVSTSLSDSGLAASTAEAMSCGLPVVVTDSGGNKEWIINGENGFIVPISTPNKLANNICFLIENENVRNRFGTINRKIIQERNNYFVEMAKMEDIYKNTSKI